MTGIIEDYSTLISAFVNGNMASDVFRSTYLAKFKAEQRQLADNLYEELDTLFGDVDAFTKDDVLLASNPVFYINDAELRRRASNALTALQDLSVCKPV